MPYLKPLFLIYLLMFCRLVSLAQQTVIPLYPENKVPFAKPGGDIPRLTVFAPEKPEKKGIAIVMWRAYLPAKN
jgi:hypothetical protein